MAEGCCDLSWHHHAVTVTWRTPTVGGGSTPEVLLAPTFFTGNSNGVSSLVGGGELWGDPRQHVPLWSLQHLSTQ